ncbi:hypothetical protein HLA87_02180 [Mycoplasma miroungigenitalium]|uniref:P60-like lipoprotein n=1 Tax=Mycoplasma miroungigenitalium TaxID=754515 RepID=A0A6M4JBZ0_9MOLU|nr:hypothetical protein [Mycoplasma miroungigenitalium]QJR43589.1 hypothetical protein HLA87_02180 [Mycoplasma miroungigenitalium]
MKKINLLLASPALALPVAVVSCGQNIDTTAKLKQIEEIKKTAPEMLKKIFTHSTLLSLYDVKVDDSSKFEEIYKNTFNDENTTLFKDSWKAFQLYSKNKLDANPYYFAEKLNEWVGDKTLKNDEIQTLSEFKPGDLVPLNKFKILWLNEKTGIRDDLEKMLIVNKYFHISDKDNLKKIDSNFKYDKDLKFELNNYLLSKYAVDKQYAQIWTKDINATNDADDFFTNKKIATAIDGVDSFNTFWKETDTKKQLNSEIEFVTGHEIDKKLYGYSGFKQQTNQYSLKWSFDSLKSKQQKDLYGFYDVVNDRLVNAEIESNFAYSPYKKESTDDKKPVLVYVNQIAPIGAANETELPNTEADADSKDKNKMTKVKLLSFEQTMYKDKLDVLAYIFFLNDSELFDKAINSFAKMGYKIKINKTSDALREIAKDMPFVELI